MVNLIEGAKQGNAESLAIICDTYKKQIYYFCKKLVSNGRIAGDLCCETFNCAFERLDTLEKEDQFFIWLKNIAAIRCYNYIHKMKPMLFLQSVGDTNEPLFTKEEAYNMQKGETDELTSAKFIDKMLDRLNDAQRMTIMLHYYNNLSIGRIAKIMGCETEIVKSRMIKGAEHIKNTVEFLKNQGIILAPIDFKQSLQLTAKCCVTPKGANDKLRKVIDMYTSEVVFEDTIEHSGEYNISDYINPVENAVSEDEEKINEFISVPDKKHDFSLFAPFKKPEIDPLSQEEFVKKPEAKAEVNTEENAEVLKNAKIQFIDYKSESTITPAEPSLPALQKDAKRKINKPLLQRIITLSVVLVVAIVAFAVRNGNKNELTSAKKVKPAAKQTTSSVTSSTAPVLSEATVEFSDNQKTETTSDGTVYAKTKYNLPKVTLNNKLAEEKINNFFINDKNSVIDSYSSDEKRAQCEYSVTSHPYGAFSPNLNEATLQAGRVDNNVVCIKKNVHTFLYGNIHDETSCYLYCFSAETGEQLNPEVVFTNFNEYVNAAVEYVSKEVENNQANGEYTLLSNYKDAINSAIVTDGSWYLDQNGVTYIFNEEELALYGAGVQTVTVPYEEIEEFMNEQYIP